MAEIVLFHHAQGLTPGVTAFADELRQAGHIVHTPDLFDGCTFDSIEKGMSFVKELGFGEVMERGERAVAGPDPARSARGPSFLFLYTGLGVWAGLAEGRTGSDPWHGCRSDLRG